MFADENVAELTPRKDESSGLQVKSKTSAVVYHISEHQRAERSQQWFAMIVESSSDAIIGKSLEGIILSWNRGAKRLFGYSAREAIGRPVSILLARNDAEEALLFLERIGRGEHIKCREMECVRRDGKQVCVSLAISPIKNNVGVVVGASIIARDINDRKRAEDRLHHLALHDTLTGLPNRLLFRERVSHAITQACRNGHQVAVLFIDLNDFKEINDLLGHQIGDRLLQVTASRLRRCLRDGDAVARLGGDEFVVSLSALADSGDAALIADKIDETLREPFRVGSHELNVSASIGIGIYPADGQDVETLMHAADTAMYHAKRIYHAKNKALTNCQLVCNAVTPPSVRTSRRDS